MTSVIERLASFTVGTVLAVAPDQLVVTLDLEAPQATALNTGVPMGFPRINAIVLIPTEGGAVVGAVSRITSTRQPALKRPSRDLLIDLPAALRLIELTPIGTLITAGTDAEGRPAFKLTRGVPVLPSVGDPVLLPSREQTRSIVEGHGADRRVLIGTAPFGGNARVTVDPDKLFGRHLAILGNTGSGKSCSVAGIIRWCLESARDALLNDDARGVNARFIVLDPNGEYGSAFNGGGLKARTFSVGGHDADAALSVPGWLWNSQEWAAFTNAQPGSQRPLLLKALRMLRNATPTVEGTKEQVQRRIKGHIRRYQQILDNFPESLNAWQAKKAFGEGLDGLAYGLVSDHGKLPPEADVEAELKAALLKAEAIVRTVEGRRAWSTATSSGYNDFQQLDIEAILDALETLTGAFVLTSPTAEVSEDAPIPFDVAALPSIVEEVARASGGNALTNVEPLVNRIQVMLGDERMHPIITGSGGPDLLSWLNSFVGEDQAANGQIAVIDLSLVPSDVIHVAVSVIARLIFDAVQRYKKAHPARSPLPTTIVLEEAHSFIRQDGEHGTNAPAADTCRQTFERIAREGRKFGLGLLLSSQRPSELSPTVLAQCNTFLLHRLVNDLDQKLVRKLVPDALGSLLDELPTLPSQQAILLGWATPLPVLVRMRDLPKANRPQSDDPDFWDVWTGKEARQIDWEKIVRAWEHPGAVEGSWSPGDEPVAISLGANLAQQDAEEPTVEKCEHCGATAARRRMVAPAVIKIECAVCEAITTQISLPCGGFGCTGEIAIDARDDLPLNCPACDEEIDAQNVADALRTSGPHGTPANINCAECETRGAVVPHGAIFICSRCFNYDDVVGTCTNCQEGRLGGGSLNFSAVSGCGFCEGKL